MQNWADALDDDLIKKYQLHIINIPAAKQNFLFWLKATLLNRFLAYFKPSILPVNFLAYAANKRSWQLMQYLKKSAFDFDQIQAHNLGALYPAYYWAKKKQKTFSFDVEDFHPDEKIVFQALWEKQRRIRLMKLLLPAAKYVSAASPMISWQTEKLINRKAITINNSFPEAEFKNPEIALDNVKLKLIWFSQNISFGRGLEQFIDVAKCFADAISITLIGNLDVEFEKKYISQNVGFISVLKPMNQEQLHANLAYFDVGLALEDLNADFNRNICLTNKIWAYFQSGLYILATDTLAQNAFINQHSNHGQLINLKKELLKNDLIKMLENKQSLVSEKFSRYISAKTYSFEKEMSQVKDQLV